MNYSIDLDSLYLYLNENSLDWLTWMALADWYEEEGDSKLSAAVRWMITRHQLPYNYSYYEDHTWQWYRESKSPNRVHTASDIPDEVFYAMQGKLKDESLVGDERRCYKSLCNAVKDLSFALSKQK